MHCNKAALPVQFNPSSLRAFHQKCIIWEIFRLDRGQISSNLLKKAFATWQHACYIRRKHWHIFTEQVEFISCLLMESTTKSRLTPSISIDTQSTLDQHLSWLWRSIHESVDTLFYWLTVDQVPIECRLRCPLSVNLVLIEYQQNKYSIKSTEIHMLLLANFYCQYVDTWI